MKKGNRILLIAVCVVLLGVSWIIALTGKTDTEKQIELIDEAEGYLADEIYVYSVPLLEEAASYDGEYTAYAQERLKGIYKQDLSKNDYGDKYEALLIEQMSDDTAGPEVFQEAADFYFSQGEYAQALHVLLDGIGATDSAELVERYEDTRYAYFMSGNIYEDVTAVCSGAIQVKRNGLWGAANSSGNLILPCEYDSVSTWSGDRFIVKKGNVISAVNAANERIAMLHAQASAFTNAAQNRVGLYADGAFVLATCGFGLSDFRFEELGMFSNGYAAARVDGKWGLIATDGVTWLVEPTWSGVVTDELGRCFCQNAVFLRKDDGTVLLFLSGGTQVGGPYEDARPFADGWAAVKKDGKWGFIDTNGDVMIDYQFEDALSFGQHLAAVKVNGLWGYVSLRGEVVIEPVFKEARSFANGRAAVKTEAGWQFITLLEYEEG